MKRINGKRAIQLNELIKNVNPRYWIDEGGEIWEKGSIDKDYSIVKAYYRDTSERDKCYCFGVNGIGSHWVLVKDIKALHEKHHVEHFGYEGMVQLNKLVACDPEYYLRRDGEIFRLSGKNCFIALQDANVSDDLFVIVKNADTQYYLHPKSVLEIAKNKGLFPEDASVPEKEQWAIGQLFESKGTRVSFVKNTIFPNEQEAREEMINIIKSRPNDTLALFELKFTLHSDINLVWSKA